MALPKYVVFKGEDWYEFHQASIHGEPHNYPTPVDDAVVIRRQDVFAPPALDAYANSIQVAITAGGVEGNARVRLARIADFFHEQAVLSWDTTRKLPD